MIFIYIYPEECLALNIMSRQNYKSCFEFYYLYIYRESAWGGVKIDYYT